MKKNLLNQPNISPAKTSKRISKSSLQWMALLVCSFLFAGQTAFAQGTWTPLVRKAPHANNGVMLVMSDGTILCHTTSGGTLGDGTIFDKLTPDSTGSYINGTWSSIAPMVRERYSFSSCVMKDGRVYAAGGEYGTDGTQAGAHGEVYDPVTDTWIQCTGPGKVMSDGNCKILDNNKVLQAIVDVPHPTSIVIYDPTTNAYSTGPSTRAGQNESMWMKLPDNSILFVDEGLQTSERYIPATNTWIADANVPVVLYDPYGLECGPALMLPDGRAFFMGATGHTAYYTPSGTTAPGSWVAGPDFPTNTGLLTGMPDAPSAMMVNGKILVVVSAIPTSSLEFAKPAYFYEFDYLTNTWTQINAPAGGLSVNAWSQSTNLVDLPDGNVLYAIDQAGTASLQYYVYKPSGAPLAAGKPVITGITPLTCTTYRITGHGFNGISEGSAFGDENENDSNYPLIRLTSGGRVYYARSYNWNSTGVQRGNAPDTAYFSIAGTMPNGPYSLYVVANGIASDPIAFTDSTPSFSSSVTPPYICSGTAFTYTPTSNTTGVIFTWTRPAVTGISNPAITSPQTSNPNEILTNTTSQPITVVYNYTVTGNGCSNPVNVSVVVNPPPKATFSAIPTAACALPDSVSFTNTSIAGSTYSWYFGDGNNSTSLNPVHAYTSAGSYSVKLVASSNCGIDSVIKASFIVINPPSGPTVTSPVNIACGTSASLNATGSDTLTWYNLPSGGNPLGTGAAYNTPALNTNTTYYVSSNAPAPPYFCPPLNNTFGTGTPAFTGSNFHACIFNVFKPCTLVSVLVYSTAAGNRTIMLEDAASNILQSKVINIPNGTSTITLNFPLNVGTGFQLGCGDNVTTTNLFRNAAGATYPYSDPGGYVTITGNDVPDTVHYYYFYNWKLQGPPCISPRTPVNVVINSAPVASFTDVVTGNVVNFTNTSTGSTTYSWNFGDGNTSPAQNPIHTYSAIGTYTVTLTSYNGACYDTTIQTVVILSVGINSTDLTNALAIFPNPSNGMITIFASLKTEEQIQVTVSNLMGEIIYETIPVVARDQQFHLNLENESKGIYFVQLKTGNGFVVKKLVLN